MPAASEQAVRIEGLRELERAFKLYGRGLEKGVREALETAADPVRFDAQGLAVSTIRKSAVDWSAMRVGVTRRTAYITPVQRGTFSRSNRRRYGRPKIVERLLTRAMEPALAQNIPRVEREVTDALNDLAKAWARV